LNWYHAPASIQELTFNYYEKLTAKVQTKQWTTGFFLFDLGLFQGCVLSTILFNCVFQLLLDMLKPLAADGYKMKDSTVAKISLAYADDLSLVTNTLKGMQKALGVTEKFLARTETMKAKPQKCVSYAAKQHDPRNVQLPHKPINGKKYAPYDPLLTIGGKQISFIVTPCTRCSRGANCPTGTCCPCSSCHTDPDPNSLFHDHFKFLGRRTGVELNEIKTADLVRKKFKADMDLVDNTGLNGLMKLWLYKHFVTSRLSWPFIVHNFSLSFAIEMENPSQCA
jgi:hypothetical protein